MQVFMPANTVRNLPSIENLRLLYNGRDTHEHPSGVFVYDFEKGVLEQQAMSQLPLSFGVYDGQRNQRRYNVSFDGTVVGMSPDGSVQVYPYWAQDPSQPMGIQCHHPAISADDQQIVCIDDAGVIWLGSRFSGNPTPYFADERTFNWASSEFHLSADYLVIQNNDGVWVADNATRQIIYQNNALLGGLLISPNGQYGVKHQLSSTTANLVCIIQFTIGSKNCSSVDRTFAQDGAVWAWSPDSDGVIFSKHDDSNFELYQFDLSEGVYTLLTKQSGQVIAVNYDRSGQTITYTKDNGNDYELWFIDTQDKIPYFVDYVDNRYPVAVFVNAPSWENEEEADNP